MIMAGVKLAGTCGIQHGKWKVLKGKLGYAWGWTDKDPNHDDGHFRTPIYFSPSELKYDRSPPNRTLGIPSLFSSSSIIFFLLPPIAISER
jgi:hypothetical protein